MMEESKLMGEIEGNGGINGKVEDIRGGTQRESTLIDGGIDGEEFR